LLKGGYNRYESRVHLVAQLETDQGVNHVFMHVNPGSPHPCVTWDGFGSIVFGATISNGSTVRVTIGYSHDSEDQSVFMSVVMHFEPHGHVKLPDITLHLEDGGGGVSGTYLYKIPQDITEEHLLRKSSINGQYADLERLYGLPLEEDNGKKMKVVTDMLHPMHTRQRHSIATGTGSIPNTIIKAPVALEDFSTFMQEKELAEKEEQRVIHDVLMPKWKYQILRCLKGIFRDPNRVVTLVRHWHERAPYERANSTQVFAAFIEAVLTSKMDLRLTASHVHVFVDTALAIPCSVLTTNELIFINKLYVDRKELFASVHQGFNGQYMCKRFRLNSLLEEAICRRYIVQQFALDCVTHTLKTRNPMLALTMCAAAGQCHINNKKDLFLLRLKIAMSKKENIVENLNCMGMFVSIAGSEPEYVLRKSSDTFKGLPSVPSTPFILASMRREQVDD